MDHSPGSPALRFSLAGPVRAWHGDEAIDLGPPQRRAVLAMLLLAPGRVLGPDVIVDGLWDGVPPDQPLAAVHAHVSVLRRVLEPGRAPRRPSTVLPSAGRGYLVDVVGVEVDLHLFRHRVAAARGARANGRVGHALGLLRSALDDWDGVALVRLPGPAAALQRTALLEERLTAFEDLAELQLAHAPDAVGHVELTTLARAHPLRERLQALWITAMCSQGRRADALDTYGEVRGRLVTELGIEPGPELREAHRRALAGAVPAARRAVVAPPAPAARHHCRAVGRDPLVAELAAALTGGDGRPVLAHGMPGAGVSTVAAAAAARTGHDVHTCTGRPGGPPVASAPTGSVLIIDDVRDVADLEARLGTGPGDAARGCADLADAGVTVLVAGRDRLRGLGPATRVEVPPLGVGAARTLLTTRLGIRAVREPTALTELADRSGGLAAVLAGHAERLAVRPGWTLAAYLADLDEQTTEDPRRFFETVLHPMLGDPFAGLDQRAECALAATAALPHAEFTRAGVLAACACEPRDVVLGLQELVDRHLLDEPAPGRFRFHPLLRACARLATVPPCAPPVTTLRRVR